MEQSMILLSQVVAQVESSGDIFALRYEPTYEPSSASIVACRSAASSYMSVESARMICKTSWGRYQIMGDNLYGSAIQLRDNIIQYASNEILQLHSFATFIGSLGFQDVDFATLSELDLQKFALAYNGSLIYADSLNSAYEQLVSK
jgi:hypothetical protein